MPTNAAVLEQLKNEAQYGKESLSRVIPLLKSALGAAFEFGSDALQIFHGSVTAAAAGGEIRTNGGIKVYAVHVDSPAGATGDVIVKFFNTSTATILLTTTGLSSGFSRLEVPVAATKSRTVVLLPTDAKEFQTAASYAVVKQSDASTAAIAGDAPTVTILYANI